MTAFARDFENLLNVAKPVCTVGFIDNLDRSTGRTWPVR